MPSPAGRILYSRHYGKSLASKECLLALIKNCLSANKSLTIGTINADYLYDIIKAEYPEANLAKYDGYLILEKEK